MGCADNSAMCFRVCTANIPPSRSRPQTSCARPQARCPLHHHTQPPQHSGISRPLLMRVWCGCVCRMVYAGSPVEVDSAEVESGVFGASTHAAVSAFNERRVGLRDASHCDEATWYVPPSTPEWPFGAPRT